jgi:hypothetical protein
MTNALNVTPPPRRRPTWLPAAIFACGALTLQATVALAQQILPGGEYQGTVVACSTVGEAETLRGIVLTGDMTKVAAYLQDDANTCAVGPARFTVVAQASPAKTDPKGNAWKIVKIAVPGAEGYLLTTADLTLSDNT